MSLLEHAIWWHVYPLGATAAAPHADSEPEPTSHRLTRLEPWLDYAIELGCSGLLLGPIFASTSHGYDTTDHLRLDPRLGTEGDFDRLVAAAHQRGLSVVLDGVFNHVGVRHPLVAQDSPAIRWQQGQAADGHRQPQPWEGHGDLALLNHDSDQTVELVTQAMTHWLGRGIAGWRLDVAYAVPAAFWQRVLPIVRAQFPNAVFIGEVIHGDYPTIVREGGLDTVTQYELWKATWSSITDTNCWELAWALDRHEQFCQQFLPQTFIGNHDVTRIASQVGDTGAALAAVILFTLPGCPSVYYGDEQAFRGVKGTGWEADAPLRPALPSTPSDLAPQGWWLYRLYQQLIALRRRNPWLTHARVQVVAKDNPWIIYHCTDQEGANTLEVRLDLTPHPRAVLTLNGEEQLRWAADPSAAGTAAG